MSFQIGNINLFTDLMPIDFTHLSSPFSSIFNHYTTMFKPLIQCWHSPYIGDIFLGGCNIGKGLDRDPVGDRCCVSSNPLWIRSSENRAVDGRYTQWPFQDPINWRYLPYIRPIFQAYVREYHQKDNIT